LTRTVLSAEIEVSIAGRPSPIVVLSVHHIRRLRAGRETAFIRHGGERFAVKHGAMLWGVS
jgi:hypothetical protein